MLAHPGSSLATYAAATSAILRPCRRTSPRAVAKVRTTAQVDDGPLLPLCDRGGRRIDSPTATSQRHSLEYRGSRRSGSGKRAETGMLRWQRLWRGGMRGAVVKERPPHGEREREQERRLVVAARATCWRRSRTRRALTMRTGTREPQRQPTAPSGAGQRPKWTMTWTILAARAQVRPLLFGRPTGTVFAQ